MSSALTADPIRNIPRRRPKPAEAANIQVDTSPDVPRRPDLDPFYAWISPALTSILGKPPEQDLIDHIKRSAVQSGDTNALVAAMDQYAKIDELFPGYKDLVNAGVIGAGDFAGHQNFKRQMNELYLRFEGRDMTDEEFLDNAKKGVSAGFLAGFFEFRHGLRDIFQRHNGRLPTPEEIDAIFRTGKDLTRIQAEFNARDFVTANRAELRGVTSAFDFGLDAGALSDQELQAFGEQQFGIESQLGFDVQRRVEQATRRMQRIFQGALAQGQLALPAGTTRGRPGSRVDVGA